MKASTASGPAGGPDAQAGCEGAAIIAGVFPGQRRLDRDVHAMIADPASLETGLQTMFDTANGKVSEIKIPRRKPQLFDEDVTKEEEGEE